MVIFCNETSEIDKENFRIVFLKKSKELLQKLLNKKMMLTIILYIFVFFQTSTEYINWKDAFSSLSC